MKRHESMANTRQNNTNHPIILRAGQLDWININRSGRNVLYVPGDSITILKSNEGGCQTQKWCRFFSDDILKCIVV